MAADQVGQRLDARDAHLLSSPVLSSASSRTDISPVQSVSSAAIQSAVSAVPCQKTRSALELIWSSMNVQRTTLAHDPIVSDNLLRLMEHLGVAPTRKRFTGSQDLSPLSSSSSPSPPKPQCPWCLSSKFANEKNFVQHLNTAFEGLNDKDAANKSCRYTPQTHDLMMGIRAGEGTVGDAEAFMAGFRNCFSPSFVGGFDAHRCDLAMTFLKQAAILRQ